MGKRQFKPGNMLYPVPAVLVTAADREGNSNIFTVAWAGTICTNPPMLSISVRPERYSHHLIQESGQFAINLPTEALVRSVDWCGVKSGRDVDKIAACNFTLEPGQTVSTPSIEQCPVNLECKVTEAKAFGSHTMFLAEITGVNVSEQYLDSKGKLNLQQCGLMAYAHGEYFALGRKLGDFGWSDLGTWGSLYDLSQKDESENVTLKCRSLLYNSKNNIVVLPQNKLAVIDGLEGYLIAESDNVLLICKKDEEHSIRKYVNDAQIKLGEDYI